MVRIRFSLLALTLAAAAACGGATGRARVGEDPVSRKMPPSVRARAPEHPDAEKPARSAANNEAAEAVDAAADEPAPAPVYDTTQVRAAVDATAAAADERTRLGMRLAVVEQGPNAPWLIAVVNRGTEPVRVVHDLRTLSLEVTPPLPEPDPKKKLKPRAPKPVTCALPRGTVPGEEDKSLELTLEPGEGVVDSFDPRLYCMTTGGKSLLTQGATVVTRIGWPEKTRAVWVKGKKATRVLEQSAPFIARRAKVAGSLPEAEETKAPGDASSEPKSDREAIKQMVSLPLTLGEAYAPKKPEPSDSLELVLTRGSDAATERDATVSVALVNHSKKAERVLFRRESITFEVSGPDGLVACEPGPDNRAPDRSNLSLLKPGGRLSSTSRLIELCPQGAMRRPGLYLVHARYDGLKKAAPQRTPTFSGRVISREPVAIRVRGGWGEMPAQRQPERVRVGTP